MSKTTESSSGATKTVEPRYPTAVLLNSKALAEYQRDFAKVLLVKPDYTLPEAKDILDKFFKGGKS